MKKTIIMLCMILLLTGCSTTSSGKKENFTDEMKIAHTIDLSKEDGADSVERDGDHEDSPYFKHPDFYHMTSTDTLTILEKFPTIQQTSEWSCGVDSALMVLQYFDRLGDENEESLASYRSNKSKPEATSLASMIRIFEGIKGFEIHSTYDYKEEEYDQISLEMIQDYLAKGIPVMVAWNDWGGHWQVIIGYDTMGTETTQDDVIIVADSYDTTDHNQDGYGIYGAERFFYNWTMYDFFEKNAGLKERDKLFIAVEPK
ncbi:C39 family peptidase [[Eubacterium] hominis]|uniref:C39 family peptidase n=1 Tax=[Eubacterium] hominis TaxID=2764325 RepID=UPI003A4DE126